MQRSVDGSEHAECDVNTGNVGFTVTYHACDGHCFVDMWQPDGSNHWTMTFTDRAAALREYNKWAKVPEEVT